jgi:hypothetical protein
MFSIYIFLFVVVNATPQQNIIYIMAVLLVEETGVSEENHQSTANYCKNNLCPAVNPSQSYLINEETESTTYEITLGITSEGYSLLRQRLLLFSSSLT